MTDYDQPITESTGIRTCTNPECGRAIDVEFVLQVTTRHVRWFCSTDCLIDSCRLTYNR